MKAFSQWQMLVVAGAAMFAGLLPRGAPGAEQGVAALLPARGHQGRYFVLQVGSVEAIEKAAAHGVNLFGLFPARNNPKAVAAMLERCRQLGAFAMVYLTHGRPLLPGHPAELDPQPAMTVEQYRALLARYPQTAMAQVAEISNGAWSYVAHPKPPATRLEGADNLVGNLRRLWVCWTPPGAGRAAWENFLVPVFHYEAGTDLCILELYRAQNMEVVCSRLRGTARAYPGKLFGTALTEYSWLTSYLAWGMNDKLTDNAGALGSVPNRRLLMPRYSIDDVVKGYHYCYFTGSTAIGHEAPAPDMDRVARFVQFLKDHPRIDPPLARLAIVEGLGCGNVPWQDDTRFGAAWSNPPADLFGPAVGEPASEWGEHTHLRDMQLFNVAFPDCGNDTVWRQYTGTPLGQVDVISPLVPYEGLARYKALWFLSKNVFTPELAGNLRRYLAGGGTLLMNVRQFPGPRGRALLAELFGVELDAEQAGPEAPAEVRCAEAPEFDFPARTYQADHLRLWPVKPAGAQVIARAADGRPVCVLRRHGAGAALLTLSDWTWRLPHALLVDLVAAMARRGGIPLRLEPANPWLETFVCPLADARGAAVAMFNHQVDHLGEPYYRKLYRTRRRVLGALENLVLDVDLRQTESTQFEWQFPASDLRADDEIRFRLRADGDKPGGGLYVTFVDHAGRRAWRKLGLVKVAWLDRPEPMDKYVSAYDSVPPWQSDKGFDWRQVVGLRLAARRLANGPIRYRLHVVEVAQLSMMVDEKLQPERKNIPYRGTARLDLEMLGLGSSDLKVYRADTRMNLAPLASRRDGATLVFPVAVDGDWAEYLVK